MGADVESSIAAVASLSRKRQRWARTLAMSECIYSVRMVETALQELPSGKMPPPPQHQLSSVCDLVGWLVWLVGLLAGLVGWLVGWLVGLEAANSRGGSPSSSG